MSAIQMTEARRRWTLRLAGLAAVFGLIAALAANAGAQQPPPPAWFWGDGFNAYAGDTLRAVDPNGNEIAATTIGADGRWHVIIDSRQHTRAVFQLDADDGQRVTDGYDVQSADLTRIMLSAFSAPPEPEEGLEGEIPNTLMVRIIARRAPDGRVEFGMRPPEGEDIFPRARYFPATGPNHNRWLTSSEIDFGSGFTGRIIARRAPDGRVEFGFRVAGYDDLFPSARYFPATGPNHNRWLRSSEIEIHQPR